MSTSRTIAAALSLFAFAACGRPEHAADAEKVAAQFIRSDTLGNWEDAMAIVKPCDRNSRSAAMSVTTAVDVWKARAGNGADSIVVFAFYHVVGIAAPGETDENGATVWHFTAAKSIDTVAFAIAPDASGNYMIACGPLPVHRVPSQMLDQTNEMDSASRRAFIAATTPHF